MKIKAIVGFVAVAIILSEASMSLRAQGSLTPPGAPGPVFKTLQQVEPRFPISVIPTNLTIPGPYYLTTNLSSSSGITIQSDNVSIDLNGFALTGQPGSGSGILISGHQRNLSVANGTIANWGSYGIAGNSADGAIYDHLRFFSNSSLGLDAGTNAIVSDCIVVRSGSTGIAVRDGSQIRNCIAATNVLGIGAGGHCQVTGCSSVGNSSSGISLGGFCVVSDCRADANGLHGINASIGGCIIRNTTAFQNKGHGIVTSLDSQLTACVARSNGTNGFNVTRSVVVDCIASLNNGHGIFAASEANRISGCTVDANVMDGIYVANGSLVTGNTCLGRGIVGTTNACIRLSSSGNRVEGNLMSRYDNGLVAETSGNLIIRNSGNGITVDYSVAAGNTVGPVVTSSSIATNNNPHANYEF